MAEHTDRPENAARALDEKLRPYPWYLSIGIGNTERGVALFVYVKTVHRRELQFLSRGWMGYPVFVRPVGSIKPTAQQECEVCAYSSEAFSRAII
jgi:hypothetical protein